MSFQLSILSPQKRVEDFYLRLDDNSQVMGRIMQNTLNDCATEIRHLKERILGQRPADRLTSANAELLENKRRICEGFQNYLNVSRSSLDYLKRSLELLDPKTSLKRGYSITIDASSKGIIKSKSELVPGKNIITLLKDGSVESVVKEEKDNGLDSLFG
ncbi:Exodeoxyribonuclease 7 large subunit [bioreactor metagenome]|uniref:Exodeoxyribonuclease 7 large subunit n=1 Tax=bioreactor metagenome TaxID=1076179 RepID=A0A645J7M9_9ZZZZ